MCSELPVMYPSRHTASAVGLLRVWSLSILDGSDVRVTGLRDGSRLEHEEDGLSE